ncbi:MAG: (d)CMP kinase [Flavobacteriaceae bacterium]|nr:(d)CMP kinase [Flavobacteriaceae bacterium]
MKNKIIAIDGYASTGKSTLSKKLAKYLDYIYIDTGFMYRAITYYALKKNLFIQSNINSSKLENLLNNSSFSVSKKYNCVLFNKKLLGDEVRTIIISEKVSKIAMLKKVRDYMVIQQRALASKENSVVEGRDIGTIVFPDATKKFFLTADQSVRAKRRYKELIINDPNVSYEQILKNVIKRDHEDSNRKLSPLKRAKGSIEIDTTKLTIDQAFDLIISNL